MSSRNMPKISVLVPIYNVEAYLRECLTSLRDQTFESFEAICINDGSTDSSREIIQEFLNTDDRFSVIDKPNSGYGASMNQGLDVAQGEYIGILESDDFFEHDALEKLYNAAHESKADVAKADFNLYWSKPSSRFERFNWVRKGEDGVSSPQKSVQVFYRKPSIWSAIYKRGFLSRNNIRFLETPGASYQDAGFNFKVWACAHTIVLIDDTVLAYRQDNESSSVNSPGKVYCVCDEYEEMFSFIENKPTKDALIPILIKMQYDSYMWNYDRLVEPLQREFVIRMSDEFKKEDENKFTDYSLFEPWKKVDRQAIIEDPIAFHDRRIAEQQGQQHSKLDAAKRLYRDGGLTLVAQTALKKLFK